MNVANPQNRPKKDGIRIKATGIKDLKFGSKVSDMVIQYKLLKK